MVCAHFCNAFKPEACQSDLFSSPSVLLLLLLFSPSSNSHSVSHFFHLRPAHIYIVLSVCFQCHSLCHRSNTEIVLVSFNFTPEEVARYQAFLQYQQSAQTGPSTATTASPIASLALPGSILSSSVNSRMSTRIFHTHALVTHSLLKFRTWSRFRFPSLRNNITGTFLSFVSFLSTNI